MVVHRQVQAHGCAPDPWCIWDARTRSTQLQHKVDLLQRINRRAVVRKFAYSAYPRWMSITAPSAGQYAWKAVIIKTVLDEPGVDAVLWMDSGEHLSNPWQAAVHRHKGKPPPEVTWSQWMRASVLMRDQGFWSPALNWKGNALVERSTWT